MYCNRASFFYGVAFFLFSQTFLLFSAINVVTITEDFASIAKSIGGNLVSTQSLIKGSRNLHNINIKPSMVLKVRNADLLIRLGMGQDSWIDGLILAARNPSMFPDQLGYLDASIDIRKLEVPTGNIDGSHGDVHKYGNPHYWLNPSNGIIIANQIRKKLIVISPENRDVFNSNFKTFSKKLNEKILEWQEKMSYLKNAEFVSYHKVWAYFFDAFQLNHIGELEPYPGVPPTTRHFHQLKQKLQVTKKEKIVLCANFYPKHVAKFFSKDVNAKLIYVPINVGEHGITSYDELFEFIIKELTQ